MQYNKKITRKTASSNLLECYFEILTDDGNYFCKDTREKELERTLWAHPNAEVITWDADSHKIMLDKQPLSNICKPWQPFVNKLPKQRGVVAGYKSE